MSDSEMPDEAPLDPATERVRRKMVRLLAVSIGIMFIGLMAVLFAIVYRMNDTSALPDGASVVLAVPEGAEVLESDLDGDRIALRLRTASPSGPVEEILIFDSRTGTVLSRHPY